MHFQENHVILYVFLYDVIFLIFVFLRCLCKFSIISELSFMQWSLYCTISHYALLHFFQLLKKHRFCIHFFSWGLSDPKWPRNNKNNRFLKKKFHDPRETQKFCFLATCPIHVREVDSFTPEVEQLLMGFPRIMKGIKVNSKYINIHFKIS